MKQHGGKEVFVSTRSDQAGTWTAVAGTFSIDFLSTLRPSIRPIRTCNKAAFIDIDDVLGTAFDNDFT
jgi:hypothetical protein